MLVPSAVVLSHHEQLARLSEGCPEAVPAAVVAGDPCLDQLRASRPFRDDYRRAWEILPDQQLVVLSSTWSGESQLGKSRDVVRHALATLPRDEFRIAAIIHPNVWYGHSRNQLLSWLAPWRAAGLTIIRPEGDGWKAALAAADAVVGDYGSVTFYGAALGLPTLLSAPPVTGTLADASPIARLLPLLPRVRTDRPLPGQLDRAARRARTDPRITEVTAHATSLPGRSARTLRALFYDRMRLREPADPVVVRPADLPDASRAITARRSPVSPATMCTTSVAGDVVTVRRYPDHLGAPDASHPDDAHLVVDGADPDERRRLQADVVIGRGPATEQGLAAVLGEHPGCWTAALADGPGACRVGTRSGLRVRVTWRSDDPRMDTAVAASALYGRPTDADDTAPLSVRVGGLVVALTVTRVR